MTLAGDLGLLRVLAELGAGFDCASTAEVAAVLALGVSPERIVFANACKRPSDIKCVFTCMSGCVPHSARVLHRMSAAVLERKV